MTAHANIVELVNKRLVEDYGRFSTTDKPIWRVIWSEDQLEKRWVTHTAEGWELVHPTVMEVPKYRQWINNKYVLERMVAIPEFVENELVEQISYEPVWVFEDKYGNPLPPVWSAVRLVVEQVYKAAANAVGAKYKDPELCDPKDAKEIQAAKIDKLVEELFGNESEVGDALAHGDGVGFTTSKLLGSEETK